MQEIREELAAGVYFTHIMNEKYETARLTVNFICPINEETITEYTLLMSVLRQSSLMFPSFSELNRALSDLYGAVLYSDSTKIGDAQVLSVGTEFLKKGMNGEDISVSAADLLCGMLFSPKINDNAFDKNDTETEKENLRAEILSEINDKRRYALKKTIEILFQGEPFALSVNGNVKRIDGIDGETLYRAYRRMLEEAAIEIIYDGDNPDAIKTMMRDNISKIGTRNPVITKNSKYFPHDKPMRFSEKMDINQTKQVLMFKVDEEDAAVSKVLNGIFGGTAFSKLFLTVREKMSLCYYCNSSFVRSKNIIIVECGVDNGRSNESESAILAEFEKIKAGDISKEELENTEKYIAGLMKSLNDTPSSYFDRLISKSVLGGITVDEEIKRINEITAEDIVSAANKMTFCGSFVLEGEKSK